MTEINERLTGRARDEIIPGGWRLRLRLWWCHRHSHAWRQGIFDGTRHCLRCGLHEGFTEHGGYSPLVERWINRGYLANVN